MELFHANKQWSTRPDDQEFPTVQALYDACKGYADSAKVFEKVPVSSLRVEAIDGDVKLIGRGSIPAQLTHYSFGQLCTRVAAPTSYLRELPATLAAQNLNHGLAKSGTSGDTVNMMFHQNNGYLLRSVETDRYHRIWNYEIAARLLRLQNEQGFVPPQPDMWREGRKVRVPLYASDHDMFAFLANPDRIVREPGNPEGLKRGLIAINSEVCGAAKLTLLRFLYRAMCGNHIIWGASDVCEVSVRHVGNVRDKMQAWSIAARKYMDESASTEEEKIKHAVEFRIGADKDKVIDALFGLKAVGLSRKVLEAGYLACQPDVDGDPRSPWGIAQGLTRHSQTIPYADDRTTIDQAAGRIVDAF